MPLRNRCARLLAVVLGFSVCSIGGDRAFSEGLPAQPAWVQDYGAAIQAARQQGKMIFVVFEDGDAAHAPFATNILAEPSIAKRLGQFVCVKVPRDATIEVAGKSEVLLKYASFKDMEGKAGVAILDFAHKDAAYYGYVVSTFPFPSGGVFSVEQLKIMLELPPGSKKDRNVAYKASSGDRTPVAKVDAPAPKGPQAAADEVHWFTSYAKAVEEASTKRKMMVVFFTNNEPASRKLETETFVNPLVVPKLRNYVCVRIPVDAKINSDGKDLVLIEQRAFQEMLRRPGVAILDFVNMECAYGGCVVSTFPLTQKLSYDAQRMAVILDLPAGTLTQRTLVYAVRIHPDHPKSTSGQVDKNLVHEAESHSQYQANIRVQGHHSWDSRFQRINAILPFGLIANEVCAESWPGENLVDAAIECVRCWRFSDGHWSSVVAPHRLFAYDMKRGQNGIWYATGIFGKNR